MAANWFTAAAPSRTGTHVPGDGLLHPVIAGAIVLLIVNDHVLKALVPGLLTGKLSDIAGMMVLPAMLVAAAEIGLALARRRWQLAPRAVLAACAASGLAFALVKLTPVGAASFGAILGLSQWIPGAVVALTAGSPLPPAAGASVAADASDLVALLALAPAAAIGVRRARRSAAQHPLP